MNAFEDRIDRFEESLNKKIEELKESIRDLSRGGPCRNTRWMNSAYLPCLHYPSLLDLQSSGSGTGWMKETSRSYCGKLAALPKGSASCLKAAPAEQSLANLHTSLASPQTS
jgi:hypothetical protein